MAAVAVLGAIVLIVPGALWFSLSRADRDRSGLTNRVSDWVTAQEEWPEADLDAPIENVRQELLEQHRSHFAELTIALNEMADAYGQIQDGDSLRAHLQEVLLASDRLDSVGKRGMMLPRLESPERALLSASSGEPAFAALARVNHEIDRLRALPGLGDRMEKLARAVTTFGKGLN